MRSGGHEDGRINDLVDGEILQRQLAACLGLSITCFTEQSGCRNHHCQLLMRIYTLRHLIAANTEDLDYLAFPITTAIVYTAKNKDDVASKLYQ